MALIVAAVALGNMVLGNVRKDVAANKTPINSLPPKLQSTCDALKTQNIKPDNPVYRSEAALCQWNKPDTPIGDVGNPDDQATIEYVGLGALALGLIGFVAYKFS